MAVHSSTIILVFVCIILYCGCCVISLVVVMQDCICKQCMILTFLVLGSGVGYAKIDNLLQQKCKGM
jgi:hypothetical protein